MKTYIRIGLMLGMLAPAFASAADWSSCADDLDRLRRAAGDAADKANEVKSKADELENCRTYPNMYDFYGDRCRSKASDYESELSYLESELSTVDSRIRSARSSCDYDLGQPGAAIGRNRQSSGNGFCDLLRSYKSRLPMKSLMETCTKSMSDVECKKCLGTE